MAEIVDNLICEVVSAAGTGVGNTAISWQPA